MLQQQLLVLSTKETSTIIIVRNFRVGGYPVPTLVTNVK